MEFRDLQQHWNAFGATDPMWAILTDPSKKGGKWDAEEFFRSGEFDIQRVVEYAKYLSLAVSPHTALDFGCGLGRLSQALCRHFETVHGVDVAASMIEQARRLNRNGSRCTYHLNETNDLRLFDDGTFDFVYSLIVLQHMRPDYAKRYLREFLRVLRPGGIALVQLPSHRAAADPDARSESAASLPNAACRARLEIDAPVLAAVAGTAARFDVRVMNASTVAWPASWAAPSAGALLLGGRWLDAKGDRAVGRDARWPIPKSLAPGEEIVLPIAPSAPATPSTYLLELDMIQDGVGWFRERGSEALRRQVRVSSERRLLTRWFARAPKSSIAPIPEVPFQPTMEMYGIPTNVVVALVESNGGKIVDIRQVQYADPSWIDFRYCFRKE